MKKILHLMGALLTTVALTLAVLLSPPNSAPAQAVVGGENVGAYPWAAALLQKDDGRPKSQRFVCSGALIKPGWVITAAHCIDDFSVGDTVVVGRDSLQSTSGYTRTAVQIKTMWGSTSSCSAGYRSRLCDVALVKLSSSVPAEDLDLAGASVLSQWGAGTGARAYGYGRTCASCSPSLDLKRTNGSITSLRENHYTLFARDSSGAVCYGDSGGPLIITTSEGPKLVGIVRAATDSTAVVCRIGDNQSFVKVGWRGSAANSPVCQWITSAI